jgi:hypothetical protein
MRWVFPRKVEEDAMPLGNGDTGVQVEAIVLGDPARGASTRPVVLGRGLGVARLGRGAARIEKRGEGPLLRGGAHDVVPFHLANARCRSAHGRTTRT